MKKFLFSMAIFLAFTVVSNAQNTYPSTGAVGIGTATPATSSLLEVKSTTKGVLLPRMTGAQRIAIPSPANGLLVYQTDGSAGLWFYNVNAWQQVSPYWASSTLSNLKPVTAINVSLLPATTASINLGSSSKTWLGGYFSGTVSAGSVSAGSSGVGIGVTASGSSYGVYGISSTGYGIYGVGSNSSGIGVFGDGGGYGVYATGNYGVYATGTSYGLYGTGGNYGVSAYSANGYGIYGNSGNGYGVYGFSNNNYGVYGNSGNYIGGYFFSSTNNALWAKTTSTSASVYAGVFEGNVYTYGTYSTSDKNIKKNIHDVDDGMAIINKLKPKNYEFRNDDKFAALHLPTGNHYGLLAQDVAEILPDLVREAPLEISNNKQPEINNQPNDGKPATALPKQTAPKQTKEIMNVKAINYTELIPILIKGMQELSAQNADLQNQVNELKSLIKAAKTSSVVSSGFLKQNIPNPASNNTLIRYTIPGNTLAAKIIITDNKGSALKVYNASGGEGQITLTSGTLPAGTYNYSLYVNDKVVDSKQMVILK